MMLAITNSNAQSMPSVAELHETLATISASSDEKTQPANPSEEKKIDSSKKKKQKEAKRKENEQEDDTSSLLLTTP